MPGKHTRENCKSLILIGMFRIKSAKPQVRIIPALMVGIQLIDQ
jgi:hypothetical protein